MTPVFSSDIIARVKDETDIAEIVRQHVSLKAAGSVFKGLCPFHKEKTPSFIVTPSRGRYHCFGCGAGGDAISFLMEIEGLSFPEAVEILARPLDIDLSSYLADDEAEGERRSFHRANETAMGLWKEALWDTGPGKRAAEYLARRGFQEKVLRDFDVGWAPGGSGWLEQGLAKGGVDSELAHRADLLRRGDRPGSFAYFRNRIIFPIKNISRQVVGFGGRVIDEGEPKYLNSADSSYFSKGRLLYGFEASRMPIAREKTAILVEGYLDVLALVQVGIHNVVATCGTAFTEEQAKLIRRGAQRVLLVFDGDKAGLKAAVRSADVALRNGLEPRIVTLPDGEDPASLVIDHGVEEMADCLHQSQGYIPFLKGLAEEKGAGREVNERALRQALQTVVGIPDLIKQEYVLQEAAEVFGMPVEILRSNLANLEPQTRKTVPTSRAPARSIPAGGDPGPAMGPPPPELEGPDGPDGQSGLEVTRRGPRVRRRMGLVQVENIETEMLSHLLWDDSGNAARTFLDCRDDLILVLDGAETLAGELGEWAAESRKGPGVPPREFILARWNTVGDSGYRAFVSRLLEREDRPQTTDFAQVIKDCLGRLKQGHRPRQG
jgi:DNA primase|nr:DNA primase [Candidatus Krumholzibacteria bacterium]